MMDDLARRAVACRHWRWMQGMTSVWGDDDGQPMRWLCRSSSYGHVMCGPCADGHPRHNLDALPDLTDPATLGCLLALVAEAHGVTLLDVHVVGTATGSASVWCVRLGESSDRLSDGPNKCAALVAALEAAP